MKLCFVTPEDIERLDAEGRNVILGDTTGATSACNGEPMCFSWHFLTADEWAEVRARYEAAQAAAQGALPAGG